MHVATTLIFWSQILETPSEVTYRFVIGDRDRPSLLCVLNVPLFAYGKIAG